MLEIEESCSLDTALKPTSSTRCMALALSFVCIDAPLRGEQDAFQRRQGEAVLLVTIDAADLDLYERLMRDTVIMAKLRGRMPCDARPARMARVMAAVAAGNYWISKIVPDSEKF